MRARGVAIAGCALAIAGCNAIADIEPASVRDDDTGVASDSTVEVAPDDATDEANDDAGADDTSACVPIAKSPIPSTGGPACPVEAGTCFPHDLTGWSPSWSDPVGAHLDVCNDAQIDAYYAACRGPAQTSAKCTAFGHASANATCMTCMESSEAADHYGVVVYDVDRNWVNVAGCVALVEPCNVPCAQAITANLQCATTACDTYCSTATDTDIATCEEDAFSCAACEQFVPLSDCLSKINGPLHPAYDACVLGENGSQAQFTAIARLMCGA